MKDTKKVLSRQNVDCIAVSQSCGSSLESVEPTHMQTIYTNCVVVVITMTNGVYTNNISGVQLFSQLHYHTILLLNLQAICSMIVINHF